MKNQGYTPGPWRLTAIPAGNSLTVMVSGSAGYDLVDALGNDAPTNPEDARLIAAAPELAEALRLVEGMLDAFPGFDSRAVPFTDKATGNIGQVVRAALAKAGLL